jgi:hypothetical protein
MTSVKHAGKGVILGTWYANTRQIGTARHWLYALSGDFLDDGNLDFMARLF